MTTASIDRRSPFLLSAYVDFRADVEHGTYTPEVLDEMMARFRRMGIRRVYWWYDGDIDPDSYWFNGLINSSAAYGPETLARIGEPVKAAVPAAHEHGLELFGILYPYSLGASETYPEGSPQAGATQIKRIGGTLKIVSRFIERHPHLRVRRRPFETPPGLQSVPIQKIRLLKKDDAPTRIRPENLEIWTSPKNYRYQRRDVSFTLKEGVEPAPRSVYDRYGELLTTRGEPVRILTLEGLNLKDPYVLVTTNFKDDGGDFRNTAQVMVEAYGPGPQPLPVEVATRRAIRPFPRDFRTYGLEFDCGIGLSQVTLDADNAAPVEEGSSWRNTPCEGVIAFAKGKNEYVPADPCEACPQVRKLWSGWVDQMLAAGVDGIDIRLGSHGIGTSAPYEYGFNEPIVEEYRRRFGTDLLSDDADLELLARLRGEYYTAFVRQTSKRVRQAGKKMQHHIHGGGYPLRPDPGRPQPFWGSANIHFDQKTWLREGLLDGVTLRAAFPEQEEPEVEEIVALAQDMGVPVYSNRYVGGAAINAYVALLERTFRDDRFSGFTIYEHQNLARATPDGSGLIPFEDTVKGIQAKAEELGIL